MAINADTLLDRLYLKSQITRWRILALVFAVFALMMATEHGNTHSPIKKEFVARITLNGVLSDNQKLYDLFNDVANNNKIKAVIISHDTPGGSAVACEEIFLRLRTLSEKKPVVAVMRSISASAGYMAAIGSDYIIAREGTITGSIGGLIETAEVTDLAEKLGIKPVIIKSSPLKGSPSPFEKATPESERVIHEMIMDFYGHFVDMVADRRKLPRERVVTLADGRVYSGKTAFQNKLIDALGGEQEAMKWLVSEKHIKEGLDIKDVEIDKDSGLLDQLSQSIAGNFFQKNSTIGLDGLISIWHPQLQ